MRDPPTDFRLGFSDQYLWMQEDFENVTYENSGCGKITGHAGLLSQLQVDLRAETAPPIQMRAQSNFIVEV